MNGSPFGKKKKKAKAFLSIYFCFKHIFIIFISWFSKQEEVKNLLFLKKILLEYSCFTMLYYF